MFVLVLTTAVAVTDGRDLVSRVSTLQPSGIPVPSGGALDTRAVFTPNKNKGFY